MEEASPLPLEWFNDLQESLKGPHCISQNKHKVELASNVTPSRKSMSWLISDGVSALYTNPASYKVGEIQTAISSMYDS
jgi:hypothetical protein